MADTRKGRGVSFTVDAVINPIINLTTEAILNTKELISKAVSEGIFSEQTIAQASKMLNKVKTVVDRDTSKLDGEAKTAAGAMNAVSSAEDKVATEGLKLLKKSVGLVEDIHERLVQSSPLLKTIESLFNLAVQLFFMPLGNKLAEVMIPAVIDLVDDVTSLWESFEGKTLGQILESMLSEGARIFGGYFLSLAKELEGGGTILGTISTMLSTIGTFIQEGTLVKLMNFGMQILNFLLEHFKELLATIIAFKVASLANQVATMYVIAVSGSLAGKAGGGIAAASIATAGTAVSAGIGTGAGLTAYNMMNGESFGSAAGHAALSMGTYGGYDIAKAIRGEITSDASTVKKEEPVQTPHVTNNFYGLTDREAQRQYSDSINSFYNNSRSRRLW